MRYFKKNMTCKQHDRKYKNDFEPVNRSNEKKFASNIVTLRSTLHEETKKDLNNHEDNFEDVRVNRSYRKIIGNSHDENIAELDEEIISPKEKTDEKKDQTNTSNINLATEIQSVQCVTEKSTTQIVLFFCEVCRKVFSCNEDLEKHKLECVKCKRCGEDFTSSEDFKNHQLHCRILDELQCEYCHKILPSRIDLETHYKSVHNQLMNRYSCHLCEKSFTKKSLFNFHLTKFHKCENPYNCHLCPKNFRIRSYLHKHLRKSHKITLVEAKKITGAGIYECEFEGCKRTFDTYNDMEHHIMYYHRQIANYKCTNCEAGFYLISELNSHLSLEHNLIYRCTKCKERFSKISELESHIKEEHGSGSETSACKICGKILDNKSMLNHTWRHVKGLKT